MYRSILVIATLLALGSTGGALAAASTSSSNGLTAAGAPLAIHGYDAVAYFTTGRAERGLAEFSAKWNDVVYRFASRESLRAFQADPERYAPQFGGFCAYGVSVGKKFDGDPEVFRIVDGKLYFNLNPEIQATWEKELKKNIARADELWSEIRDRPADSL